MEMDEGEQVGRRLSLLDGAATEEEEEERRRIKLYVTNYDYIVHDF
jgi:hypothetical protein